ncbi:MAG: hypothetical protein M3R63_09815 [Actinomycetota bacterium]|nr:hypothetical protein [Actinomycetota bacterium]
MLATRVLLPFAFGLLALAGCSNSDFITQARSEGIVVHHPDLARDLVSDLCDGLDTGLPPMGAGLMTMQEHMNDPVLSTDDRLVMQLGIHGVCSKHGEAWDAYETTYQQSMGMTEPTAPAPVVLDFGAEQIFADGVSISVTAPESYERTTIDLSYGFCATDCPMAGARVTVTVANNSTGEVDPSLAFGSATVNGQPVESLAFAPSPEGELRNAGGTLLPGQSQTFDELYWMTTPGDLVISYSHANETVHFRGEVSGDALSEQSTVAVDPAVTEVESEYVPYGPLDPNCDPSIYECGSGACDPITNPGPCGAAYGDETDAGLIMPEDDPDYGGEESSGESQFRYGCEQGYITEGC